MAIISIVLALALVAPGLVGAPTPGGDTEPRSAVQSPSILMVNVNNTTAVTVLDDGTVVAGTAGGGIAEWAPDGHLSSIYTTVDGSTSNHIVAIAEAFGDTYGITRANDTRLLRRDSTTGSWVVEEPITGAEGPLKYLSGGVMLSVLDANGSIFVRNETHDWQQPVLSLDPIGGWSLVDCDGTSVVMSRGDDTLYRAVFPSGMRTRIVHNSNITDIKLHDGYIAVSTERLVQIQRPGTGLGFNNAVLDRIRELGTNWVEVLIDGDSVHATTFDGKIIDVDLTVTDPADVELVGDLRIHNIEVNDIALRPDGTLLVATQDRLMVMEDRNGETFNDITFSQPTTNDLLAARFQEDILWLASEDGLEGLNFDSQGYPASWFRGIRFDSPIEVTGLETIVRDGTVHFAGVGPFIYTYDTFASDKPSRWAVIDPYDGQGPSVLDIDVVGGDVFVANDDGVHLFYHVDTRLEKVTGSPSDVLSLHSHGDVLFVGAKDGLWSYDVPGSTWGGPGATEDWLPIGAVPDGLFAGERHFVAVGGSLHWNPPSDDQSQVVLSSMHTITSLAARAEASGPVWAVVNGTAMAYVTAGDDEAHSPGVGGLGDAIIHGVEVGPDGTAHLATDSGIHRIEQYRTQWTHYTTSNGLSANDLRDLELEPEGDNMWVAAYGGIDVMDTITGDTIRIGTEEGLPSNLVYDVEITGGNVHVGTDEGGAARRALTGTDWSVYNTSTGLVANDVQALAILPDTLLFGTDSGVTVLDMDASTFSTHTTSSTGGGLPDDWVNCALVAGSDDILVGTARGLGVYSITDDTFEEAKVDGVQDRPVRSLFQDPTGRLWIGTDTGLVVLEDLQKPYQVDARLGMAGGLPSSEVLAIMADAEGWIWLGTSAGAAMVDTDVKIHATFTTRDGLVHDRVTTLAERPDGTIWLGTAGGLSRLDKVLWDLLPQVTVVTLDIPDVYVTLDGVRLDPDEPSSGEDVTINVTAFNPSGKRAIVTIALFVDDGGVPGTEVSRAIAYTEPGGSYNVSLTWEAVGGEQSLWVLADPDGVVPETNERNNAVALNIHVNRPPTLRDASYSLKEAGDIWSDRWLSITVEVVYSDLDGDPPSHVQARGFNLSLGYNWYDLTRVAASGNNIGGARYVGDIYVPYGNYTVNITASDGLSQVDLPLLDVRLNMELAIIGIEEGDSLSGRTEFDLVVLDPWEGDSYAPDLVLLAEPGISPPTDTDIVVPFEWTGPTISINVDAVPDGEYDLWVVATDDRGLWDAAVVESIVVEHEEDESGTLSTTQLTAIIGLVLVIVAALAYIRSRGDAS